MSRLPLPAALDEDSLLRQLLAELDAQIAASGPRCEASGRCCRFAQFGHTLFCSEMEIDLLLSQGLPAHSSIDESGCPFQLNGLCSARDRRPLGCRVFFCDLAFTDRQFELSETFIRKLKDLHEATGRPWRYDRLHRFLAERFPADPAASECQSPEMPDGN